MGPATPRHVGSSQTGAWTRVPCTGRQNSNHCATREAQKTLFFRAVLGWQQNWGDIEISHAPLVPPTGTAFPAINTLHWSSSFVTTDEPVPSPWSTLEFALGVVYSVCLDKFIMTGIRHYGITQSSFTALKIRCAPPLPANSYDFLHFTSLFPGRKYLHIKAKTNLLTYKNYLKAIIKGP